MKKASTITLITIMICFYKLNAQENDKSSLFLISSGLAIFNNGEQYGMSFSNNYVRNIDKTFTYGIRYFFAHGEGDVSGLKPQHNIHVSTTAFDFSGFYKPFKSDKNILLIGLGLSMDYTRTSYLSNTDYIVSNNKIYTLADTDGVISLIIPSLNLYYCRNFDKNKFWGINMNARDLNLYQYIIEIGGGIKF